MDLSSYCSKILEDDESSCSTGESQSESETADVAESGDICVESVLQQCTNLSAQQIELLRSELAKLAFVQKDQDSGVEKGEPGTNKTRHVPQKKKKSTSSSQTVIFSYATSDSEPFAPDKKRDKVKLFPSSPISPIHRRSSRAGGDPDNVYDLSLSENSSGDEKEESYYFWNSKFQDLLEEKTKLEAKKEGSKGRASTMLKILDQLSEHCRDFISVAEVYGRIIISEYYLTNKKKKKKKKKNNLLVQH
eukprot:TRINITY_DN4688_c0_g1_i10.p1 TRINITY_DN4688_c0_g1~~TRINITY_DN4688_c0_g1_i10.p1  ORF type:complete len:248 (+),score=52.98 TRINITY_DN4688_c0_g1_i10:800-1543(+)